MDYYKLKYIKYKNKYKRLKQHGGTKEEIEKKIKRLEPRCAKTSFSQHSGECWSDTIQTLICYNDEIKESVQNKLLNLTPKEIIDLAYFNGREKFLPPIYRRSSTDSEQQLLSEKFEKRLVKYLTLLQQRLCMHIDGEKPICKLEESSSCDIIDYNKYLIECDTNVKPRTLKRRSSIVSGVGTAHLGKKIVNKNVTFEEHKSALMNDDSSYGANIFVYTLVYCILSFCLLDNDEVIIPQIKLRVSLLKKEDLNDIFAIHLSTFNHCTGFYICDDKELFYNDNLVISNPNFIYEIKWKKLLEKYVDEKIQIFIHPSGEVFYKKDNDVILMNYDGEEVKVDYNTLPTKKKFNNKNDELLNLVLLKKIKITDDNIDILGDLFILASLNYNTLKYIPDINMQISIFGSILMYSFWMQNFTLLNELFKNDDLVIPDNLIIDLLMKNLSYYDYEMLKDSTYDNSVNKLIKIFEIIKNSKHKYLIYENISNDDKLIQCIFKYLTVYPTKLIIYLLDNRLIDVNTKFSNSDDTIIDLFLNYFPHINEFYSKFCTNGIINTYILNLIKYYDKDFKSPNPNTKFKTSDTEFILIYLKYIKFYYVDILEKIIEQMTDINITKFILHKFISANLFVLLDKLIAKGADVKEPIDGDYILSSLMRRNHARYFILCLLNTKLEQNITDIEAHINIVYNSVIYNLIELLIKNGAVVNCKCANPPLFAAIKNTYAGYNIIDLLIKNGANVNDVIIVETPLRLAIERNDYYIVNLLIKNGSNVNLLFDYKSPLLLAIEYGNYCIVKLLIENGANINFNYFGETLLQIAIEYGNRDIIKLLEQKK